MVSKKLKIFLFQPHTEEHQNEFGRAKTKDIFSLDHHIATV
jgi:hypothetical protein